MGKIKMEPYLFFKGKAREAMEFYKNIFGGELSMQTYAEAGQGRPEGMTDDMLMHARLSSEEIDILSSDTAAASPEAKKITLTIEGDDESRLTQIFEKLSEGGRIISPLKKEFWGDIYGSLTDRFGIEWMIDIRPTTA